MLGAYALYLFVNYQENEDPSGRLGAPLMAVEAHQGPYRDLKLCQAR
jgi:hypothetical protein